jgi:hypothetical protein
MTTLAIANEYGNVDVRHGLRKGYVHVPGERLQPLCRRLGVKYADALVGIKKVRGWGYKAQTDGVVVSAGSAPRLRRAVGEREGRWAKRRKPTPAQREARRQRRQEKDIAAFAAAVRSQFPGCPDEEAAAIAAHACQVGTGRVGRTRTMPLDERVEAAVAAHTRHRYTDYEERLEEAGSHDYEDRQFDLGEARAAVRPQVAAVLERWRHPERVAGAALTQ